MLPFDLDLQNYAQMSVETLSKMLASLKPSAKNPKTDWDKLNAQRHVAAINDELNGRKVLTHDGQ